MIPVLILVAGCKPGEKSVTTAEGSFELTTAALRDKIQGGWAGQVIGCTYGGPTEFSHPGTMIRDYQTIPWDSTRIEWYFRNAPGLYDDIYMDLTFLEVMNREGIDAPANSHALAFAHAEDINFQMDIATRCGQDSDCNPACAAGILGTITGYRLIPEKWRKALYPVEEIPFSTNLTLKEVYESSYQHALQSILKVLYL